MKKIILFLPLLAACQMTTPITDTDRDQIREKIKIVEVGFVSNSADELNKVYADDVVSMPPNGPENVGKESVVKFHNAPSSITGETFTATAVEIEGIGNQAYVRGTWTFGGMLDTTKLSDNGKFMLIMRKEGTDWKTTREMWSSNLPLANN